MTFSLPLQGISDESENVREVALRAGHGIVQNYAEIAIPLVLPAIQEGALKSAGL
mgnify:FL=1